MKKRILQIIPTLDRAGAEKQLSLLAAGLPADEFDALPEEYQKVVESAAAHSYTQMLALYDAKNPPALAEIKNKPAPFTND